ncbi:hypothetical protein TNIN_51061 [Trichonephila inaurata madagascariensis]|uniref:Uncharacterized protein n=1 Tax=Trichonephila inaurata madagascariensis TaxID=2747483 RepID=A0A8X6XEX0_9ARAC|nr:hypothetical protein TNIN_51061 [Trichonephila inaurata madagascariensis]
MEKHWMKHIISFAISLGSYNALIMNQRRPGHARAGALSHGTSLSLGEAFHRYGEIGHHPFYTTSFTTLALDKLSATLVFGYHFDMAKRRILTQDEIDRYMDELSEDGLEYSDDNVDFYLIVCHQMKIGIATVKIVLVHEIQFRIQKNPMMIIN